MRKYEFLNVTVDKMRDMMMAYWRSGGKPSSDPLLLDQFTIRTQLKNGSVELVNVETKKKFDLSLTKRQVQFVKEGEDQLDNPTRIISFPFGHHVSTGQDEKEEGRSADAMKEKEDV